MATVKAGRQIFTSESLMARFEQAAEIEILRAVSRGISYRIEFHDSENSVREIGYETGFVVNLVFGGAII